MKDVKLELDQIEMQQQGLERQGVRLEQIIRDKCESGTASEGKPAAALLLLYRFYDIIVIIVPLLYYVYKRSKHTTAVNCCTLINI